METDNSYKRSYEKLVSSIVNSVYKLDELIPQLIVESNDTKQIVNGTVERLATTEKEVTSTDIIGEYYNALAKLALLDKDITRALYELNKSYSFLASNEIETGLPEEVISRVDNLIENLLPYYFKIEEGSVVYYDSELEKALIDKYQSIDEKSKSELLANIRNRVSIAKEKETVGGE